MFRTELNLKPGELRVSHSTEGLFVGSCFSNNIGGKLQNLKFPVFINPFGVVYNPVSVKNTLEIIMDRDLFTEKDLSFHDGQWYSFYHHSSFSNASKEACLENINSEIERSYQKLLKAKFLFITFGTSWVFEKPQTGNVVSNCHKLPAREFNRRMLSVQSIVQDYQVFLEKLKVFNPDIKVVFTVSPIRHWKDGAVGNQYSKATLIVAIQQLLSEFSFCSYFPSYEILMDDLRDYRFYDEDMLHVNDTAINYIWSKFGDVFLDKKTQELNKQILKIIQAKSHRPFNPEGEQYQKFLKQQLKKIEELMKLNSDMDFSAEIAFFKSLLCVK